MALGGAAPRPSLARARQMINKLIDYLKQNEQDIKDITGITKKLQGPEGHISYKTFESVVLLHEELAGHIENIFSRIGRPDLLEKFNLLSITTLSLESQHAVVHFKTDTPTPLEYMRNLSTSVHEALKRVTPSPVHYFTHPDSYYKVPGSMSARLSDKKP